MNITLQQMKDFIMTDMSTQTEPWNGSGFPPAGTVCEFTHSGHGVKGRWVGCTVLGYGGEGEQGLTCAISTADPLFSQSGGLSIQHQIHEITWRKIRTPEQIATDEREKAIAEMVYGCGCDQSDGTTTAFVICGLLYDAGYRKQVTP